MNNDNVRFYFLMSLLFQHVFYFFFFFVFEQIWYNIKIRIWAHLIGRTLHIAMPTNNVIGQYEAI